MPNSDEDLNVSYCAGVDSVFGGLSRPESAEDAHDAVENKTASFVSWSLDGFMRAFPY
jgi:hypothetical protein